MIMTREQLRERFKDVISLLEIESNQSLRDELISELEALKEVLKNYKFN